MCGYLGMDSPTGKIKRPDRCKIKVKNFIAFQLTSFTIGINKGDHSMRKQISVLFLLFSLIFNSSVFASVGIKVNGTPHGAMENLDLLAPAGSALSTQTGTTRHIPVLDSTLFATGVANGGAASVASTTAALPIAYTLVRKVIPSNGDAAFTAGTLADGKPGQILTVMVAGISPSGATTGGNYTITPTTTYGFTSIKLTAVKDFVTFQFVDSTTGWIILNYGGTVTLTLKN